MSLRKPPHGPSRGERCRDRPVGAGRRSRKGRSPAESSACGGWAACSGTPVLLQEEEGLLLLLLLLLYSRTASAPRTSSAAPQRRGWPSRGRRRRGTERVWRGRRAGGQEAPPRGSGSRETRWTWQGTDQQGCSWSAVGVHVFFVILLFLSHTDRRPTARTTGPVLRNVTLVMVNRQN